MGIEKPNQFWGAVPINTPEQNDPDSSSRSQRSHDPNTLVKVVRTD